MVRLKLTQARRTLEDVLDVHARDRRPKLPPPVEQSGRAGAGVCVEREAEARPESSLAADAARGGAAAGYAQTLEWHHKIETCTLK